MPPSVAVVTDSTAYLPDGVGVRVVPVQVILDGVAYSELPVSAISRATTSRPAPSAFSGIYADLSGFSGVVSVHVSGALSGTVEAACLAAASAAVPVEVVDSRSIAMGLGFPVLAAARAAEAGGSLGEVADAARRCAAAAQTFFYVDTLEHLRRGGRIGAAASLVGSALMIKPLLHLRDGRIELLEKVRTPGRALGRLEELAVKAAAAGGGAVEVAVQHLAAPGRAEALCERLRGRLPGGTRFWVVELGAVIGVHVGPGMLGVTVSPVC